MCFHCLLWSRGRRHTVRTCFEVAFSQHFHNVILCRSIHICISVDRENHPGKKTPHEHNNGSYQRSDKYFHHDKMVLVIHGITREDGKGYSQPRDVFPLRCSFRHVSPWSTFVQMRKNLFFLIISI